MRQFLLPVTAALAVGIQDAGAQDRDRDLLPMTFVRVDSAVRRQFELDWKRLHPLGTEWAYCVTDWHIGLTQDGDTAYVVSGVQRVTARTGQHEIAELACAPWNDAGPPIAHAHPSGDCSPSRADATYAVAHAIPFALIVCGPRSTAGYTSQQFLWMSRGVLAERAQLVAPEQPD